MLSDSDNSFVKLLRDKVLENSSYVDGLQEPEGQLLIEWAMQQARLVASPIEDEEGYEEIERPFSRMMRTINALVVHRHTQDAVWFSERVVKLNDYLQSLHGVQLDEEQGSALQQSISMDNSAFLSLLTASIDAAIAPTSEASTVASDEIADEASADSSDVGEKPDHLNERWFRKGSSPDEE